MEKKAKTSPPTRQEKNSSNIWNSGNDSSPKVTKRENGFFTTTHQYTEFPSHEKIVDEKIASLEQKIDDLIVAQDSVTHTARFIQNATKDLSYLSSEIDNYQSEFNQYKKIVQSYLRNEVEDQIDKAFSPALLKADDLSNQLAKLESEYQTQFKTLAEKDHAVSNLKNKLNTQLLEVTKQNEEFKEYYNEMEHYYSILFKDDEKGISVRKEIEGFLNKIEETRTQINKYYADIFGESKLEIIEFNEEIHSKEDIALRDKDGNPYVVFYPPSSGLKDELEKAITNWNEFTENKQNEYHQLKEKTDNDYTELVTRIEGILPGATTATLSTSFSEACKTHERNAAKWNKYFFRSLTAISATTLLVVLSATYLFDITTWQGILSSLVKVAPVEFPLLWLAIFSAKRSKEHSRLQEEYLHKTNIMKTFEGLRTQIKDHESQTAIDLLLTSTINSNSYNPSSTLEKNSDPDSPMEMFASFVENAVKLSKVTGKLSCGEKTVESINLDLPPSKQDADHVSEQNKTS